MAVDSSCETQVPDWHELLAALQLQQEWGVNEVIADSPWTPLAPPPSRLERPQPAGNISSDLPSVERVCEESPAEGGTSILQARNVVELIRASQALDGVQLARTAMHHLAPVLVENAPFLLVGDVPDADEDRSGILFSGQAGMLLDTILASIGIRRETLSLAPAIPWRPPGGQRVTTRDLQRCLPILQRAIALAGVRRVVTMGATPALLLLGTSSRLSQVRGRWTEITVPGVATPVSVLPTLHPLQLSGGPAMRRNLWQDMLFLVETLES